MRMTPWQASITGIDPRQRRMICALRKHGTVTLTTLAREAGMSRGHARETLRRLAETGHARMIKDGQWGAA